MVRNATEELTQVLCHSIDIYRLSECPNLTVGQILESIERIRFGLTEKLIAKKKIKS